MNSSTENPLVSIVTPCYNHEEFLQELIESVYKQTYKKFEFSIIDDGSTDGSLEKIKELSEKYGFEYEAQSNHGLCYTLNKLIQKTQGKYIICIASDDVLFKDRLEKQVKFMETHPEYGMSYAKMWLIDEKGERKEDEFFIRFKYHGWILDKLLRRNFIAAPTVIFRRSVYLEVGKFNENLYIEDYDMWIRIAQKFQVGYLDECVTFYRRHGRNMTSQGNNDGVLKYTIEVLEKYKDYRAVKRQLEENYFWLSQKYSGRVTDKLSCLVYWTKSFPYGFYPINILKIWYKLLFFWNKV